MFWNIIKIPHGNMQRMRAVKDFYDIEYQNMTSTISGTVEDGLQSPTISLRSRIHFYFPGVISNFCWISTLSRTFLDRKRLLPLPWTIIVIILNKSSESKKQNKYWKIDIVEDACSNKAFLGTLSTKLFSDDCACMQQHVNLIFRDFKLRNLKLSFKYY